MTYQEFLKLTRNEQEACLDAFMSVLFGDKAKEASEHLRECDTCRELYAQKFADFMVETKEMN